MSNPIITISDADSDDGGRHIHGQNKQNDGSTKERDLMAEHGCTHSAVVGKTYKMSWNADSVPATECEGNNDCEKNVDPVVDSFTEVKNSGRENCWAQAQSQNAMNSCAYTDVQNADQE